jgi:hypothetical protein
LPVTQSGDTVKDRICTEFLLSGTKTRLVDFYSQAARRAASTSLEVVGCFPGKLNSSDNRVKVALT